MKSLKQVISILVAIAKAKSTVVKSRSRAMKAQLMISKLLHEKKEMMRVVSQRKRTGEDDELVNVYNKTTVPYGLNYIEFEEHVGQHQFELGQEDADDPIDDLGSVVDFVKDYQEEGSDFGLENEVDRAAEVFIRRIRSQMLIQKQESFKRFQEMQQKSI